ncbi:hypothetical protein pneo_cds_805 [Pandoravirus neocaledonia]|uniref:Uncharacterized protein n=1 Tax=Pandoravirus neocaledonia TaxID=2107708 RepID=A0A2U7UDC9_9VIRU|nr:hypothetical protein pneo_cds_805 [Pandoravirus neocaledonia]AVK76412.1 hypothetical protein pneo_cds_805 [Pandoravirus neocaledonia]
MSRTGEIMMATVFFNATQEVTAMPTSGRYALPEGTIPGTAVVFIARARGDAIPVPFAVEGADAPTRVTATKDGVVFTGDLVSVDAESLTLSTDAGVTQTVTGYDDAQIQRRDRPTVVADATAAISEARVAFMRDGLSWRPSYLIYLGRDGAEQGDEAIIEQIVGAADIRNKSDRRVRIDHTWLAATRVPLPPGARSAAPRHAPRPMAMAATPMAIEEGASLSLAAARAMPTGGEMDAEQGTPLSNPGEAARYDLGALSMDRDSTVTVPLFVGGPPAEQAAVRFCLLPTGPTAPGERPEPLARGYRFVTEQTMPPGRVTVFDPDMGFVGVADLGGAVAGEPVDLRLGPSTQVDVDVWVQVNTTYSPVSFENGDTAAADDTDERLSGVAMLTHGGEARQNPSATSPPTVVVQVTDHVVVQGVVRNGTGRSVIVVLSYRPTVGGVITKSEPPCDRMTRSVAEWEATFAPGATDLVLALEVDRGQRLVTPSPTTH